MQVSSINIRGHIMEGNYLVSEKYFASEEEKQHFLDSFQKFTTDLKTLHFDSGMGGITSEKEAIINAIKEINPYKIIHCKNYSELPLAYHTLFIGKDMSIYVDSIFGSGYRGEGSRTFEQLLKALNVDDIFINNHIFETSNEEKTIIFSKTKEL